ncbi:MAG: lipoprotein [Patescibacteria group bacterium]
MKKIITAFTLTMLLSGCNFGSGPAEPVLYDDDEMEEIQPAETALDDNLFIALSAEILCLPSSRSEATAEEIEIFAKNILKNADVNEEAFSVYQQTIEADAASKKEISLAILGKMGEFCTIVEGGEEETAEEDENSTETAEGGGGLGSGELAVDDGEVVYLSPQPETSIKRDNDLFYQNQDFNFSLEFPESWVGYKVTQHRISEKKADICFSFENNHVCILQINVFPAEEWVALGNKKPVDKIVGQKENMVFVADFSSLCEGDFQCARGKEVPEIIKTFKLEEEYEVEDAAEYSDEAKDFCLQNGGQLTIVMECGNPVAACELEDETDCPLQSFFEGDCEAGVIVEWGEACR